MDTMAPIRPTALHQPTRQTALQNSTMPQSPAAPQKPLRTLANTLLTTYFVQFRRGPREAM